MWTRELWRLSILQVATACFGTQVTEQIAPGNTLAQSGVVSMCYTPSCCGGSTACTVLCSASKVSTLPLSNTGSPRFRQLRTTVTRPSDGHISLGIGSPKFASPDPATITPRPSTISSARSASSVKVVLTGLTVLGTHQVGQSPEARLQYPALLLLMLTTAPASLASP